MTKRSSRNPLYPRCTGSTVIQRILALGGNALSPWLSVDHYFFWFYAYTDLPRWHRRHWRKRIRRLVACPSNASVSRVPHSGRIREGRLIMHNGLEIDPLSCSLWGLLLLHCNRGVHEPQEELAFARALAEQRKGALMLELGSGWSLYSLWFHQSVEEARCVMLEPSAERLEAGRKNFRLNGAHGEFIQAYVGARNSRHEDGCRVVCVDAFLRERGADCVDVLHADIQGSELEMLEGAAEALRERRVGWLFISTHSNTLHSGCEQLVLRAGYQIVASYDLDGSCSEDGILVARRPEGTAR
jgi:methyltransferase FkbM-like protein